ncbi:MAG TPA: hypothetical protein VL418_01745 [Devosiaceae bacterium]|jgi:hypothetical protein|nr:hypothetical protein [Devosiaceae bacterium]
MQMQPVSTRFRQINRGLAGAVLALLALAMLALLAASFGGTDPTPAATVDSGDLALYTRIVDRLREGQDYYTAAHIELRAGHYPTLSVFNWRTPLLLSLVSLAPFTAWAQTVLTALAAAAAALGLVLVYRQGNWILAGAAIPLLIVSLATAVVPGTVYFGEIVAGILILGSCCCYGAKLWLPGVLLALLALFIRELAAPYVMICLALALLQGRRIEASLTLLGLLAYSVYYLLHAHAVGALLGPSDFSDPGGGWIALGGLDFVVKTAAFDGMLILVPLWVSALVLPIAVLGLCAFPAGLRMALVVLIYAVLFTIAGKPFDVYWGGMYTPLLAFGLVWAPLAIRDLVLAARPIRFRLLPSDGADSL